jgi:hypothetical protein
MRNGGEDVSHTPGPWEWHREETATQEFRGYSVTYPSEFFGSGTRLVLIPPNGIIPNEADARLIAAGPDLLAALKNLMGIEALRTEMAFEDSEATAHAVSIARSAIAKATGAPE